MNSYKKPSIFQGNELGNLFDSSGPSMGGEGGSNQAMLEQFRQLMGGRAAKESVNTQTAEHHRLRKERGAGLYYGDKSDYHGLSEKEKQNWLQEKAMEKGGENAVTIEMSELTQSSCIEWAMEHVKAWYEGAGQSETFAAIDAQTRDADLKGTVLAQILVRHGWQAWYTNPDTSYTGPADSPDSEHTYSNHIAKTQGSYYDVPLTGRLVDTDANPELLNALERLPFFLSVTRGGMHVTAGVDGQVNELARGEGPDSSVIYQDPYRDIIDVYKEVYGGGEEGEHKARRLWGSGLILLPPGSPPLGDEFVPGIP